MNDVKITVGGAVEEDAARRFVDAWHRAERGESFHERHLAFESWDTRARIDRKAYGIVAIRPPPQRRQRAPWQRRSGAITAMFM